MHTLLASGQADALVAFFIGIIVLAGCVCARRHRLREPALRGRNARDRFADGGAHLALRAILGATQTTQREMSLAELTGLKPDAPALNPLNRD
jgi:hypothetical protein